MESTIESDMIIWTPEKRRLGDLIKWPRNPRYIDKKDAVRLLDSVNRFGQVETLAIGPENEVYNGHQRLDVLLAAYGADYEVDVRESSRALTEQEREQLTIYLHQGAVGEFDFKILAAEFRIGDLLNWGFERKELDLSLWEASGAPDDAGARIDEAEALQAKWGIETGQLWQLGAHRIICGDSSDPAIIEKLMGDERCRLVWTDPPYGVDYGAKMDDKNPQHYRVRTIEGDDLAGDQLEELIRGVYKNVALFCLVGASIYATSPAGDMLPVAIGAFKGSGFDFHWQLVWVKNQLVLGRGDYHFRHENVLYGWKGDGGHLWFGNRKQDSIFSVDRPKASEEHPTMKPVELIEPMIRNSSLIGDLVIDPFMGSGSTIIACERTRRPGRGIEKIPAY